VRWVGQRALAAYEEELRRRCLEPSTIKRNTGLVRMFLLATGKPVARIVRQDLRVWLGARAARGVRSTPGDLCVLREFFGLAADAGLTPRDPCGGLPFLERAPRRAQLMLGPAKVKAILAAALDDPQVNRPAPIRRAMALHARACIELLYGLGLRAGEAGAALVTDLDIISGDLLCRAIKRGPDRRLPLPPAAMPHLARYLREGRPLLANSGQDEGRLLVNVCGRPLGSQGISRVVNRLARRIGVHATPHAFRRSVATHLVRAGVPMVAVQNLLGHSSLEVTARYVLIDIDDLHRAVAHLELDEE